MGRTDTGTNRDALEGLLERERTLILAGDFDGLMRLTREKDAGFAGLRAQPEDAAALDRIRASARRNQSLLNAAARGFRAAQERLAALERPGAALRTYGRDGAPRDLTRQPSGLIRRA